MANKKGMDLPRDEMAIRKVYQPLVESGELRVVFRPGDRVCGLGRDTYRGYWKGEDVTVKIIDVPGSDVYGIAPKFSDAIQRRVRISEIEKISFEDLNSEHFDGSSPDVQNPEQLAYHLGLVYGRMPEEIKREGVTRIGLKYLD